MWTSSISRLAVLVLAGCTSVLGLTAPGLDDDRDGVDDEHDNCPELANPQQLDDDHDGRGNVCACEPAGEDRDGDGVDDRCDDCVGGELGVDSGGNGVDDGCEPCAAAIGQDSDGDSIDDACDACALGGTHDEDGDAIPDACDNCAGVPNADQANVDGDVLGDSCDVDEVAATHVIFDPFTAQDVAVWPGSVPNWSWEADGLEATATARRFSRIKLPASARYVVESLVETSAPTALYVATRESLIERADCSLDARALRLHIHSIVDTVVAAGTVPGRGRIRVRLIGSAAGVRCEASDEVTGQRVTTSVPMGITGRFAIEGIQASRFEYWSAAWSE